MNITANSIHPGVIMTDLYNSNPYAKFVRKIVPNAGKTVHQVLNTLLYDLLVDLRLS